MDDMQFARPGRGGIFRPQSVCLIGLSSSAVVCSCDCGPKILVLILTENDGQCDVV